MPVKSYIAYPVVDKKAQLVVSLKTMEECLEVLPSDNEDVVVLVTETSNEESEKELEKKLQGLDNLQCLAMVFGHEGPEIQV